jgi:hypothetical protein
LDYGCVRKNGIGDIPNWLTSKNSSGSGEVQWRVSERA